jgi:hypothetical protein
MCRDGTLRGSHPLQPFKHLARDGDEQVLAKAIAQHLTDVLDHVPWEVWRALVRPTARPPAVIGPHGLLSVAVHRQLCQVMQSNSRCEVVVAEMACGKYGSPASVAGGGIGGNPGKPDDPCRSLPDQPLRPRMHLRCRIRRPLKVRVRHQASMYCQA